MIYIYIYIYVLLYCMYIFFSHGPLLLYAATGALVTNSEVNVPTSQSLCPGVRCTWPNSWPATSQYVPAKGELVQSLQNYQ